MNLVTSTSGTPALSPRLGQNRDNRRKGAELPSHPLLEAALPIQGGGKERSPPEQDQRDTQDLAALSQGRKVRGWTDLEIVF